MQKNDAIKNIEYYSQKASQEICPFSKTKCSKTIRSEIGICSFNHKGKQQIICPNIFLKFDYFSLVSKTILKTGNYKILPEVKILNNFIDYVLVDSNDSTNYCGIEIQALDTTGNYKWVFGENVKPFCINWKTTKKTIISQLLEKIPFFKNSGKKLVLIIQDTFFAYCGFPLNGYEPEKDFHILKLHYENGTFRDYSLHSYNYDILLSLFIDDTHLHLDEIIERNIKKPN